MATQKRHPCVEKAAQSVPELMETYLQNAVDDIHGAAYVRDLRNIIFHLRMRTGGVWPKPWGDLFEKTHIRIVPKEKSLHGFG
jgi:hypothetical protein